MCFLFRFEDNDFSEENLCQKGLKMSISKFCFFPSVGLFTVANHLLWNAGFMSYLYGPGSSSLGKIELHSWPELPAQALASLRASVMDDVLHTDLSNAISWWRQAPISVTGKKGCFRTTLGRHSWHIHLPWLKAKFNPVPPHAPDMCASDMGCP